MTARTALWVVAKLAEATSRRGYDHLTLDFGRCIRAWPEGMCPLICQLELFRAAGCGFSLKLPQDERQKRLFVNANWAHLIAPEHFDSVDMQTPLHLPATWYDAATQSQIVTRIVEITMRSMEIERPVLAGLEWSVNEITDNVLVHAESPAGLVQAVTQRDNHRIGFVVADAGRGIFESMREGFPSLRDDEAAIGEAIKQGVTRNPEIGQGNGLAGTLRVAVHSHGSFSLLSGRGLLSIYLDPDSGAYGDHHARLPARERYQGTAVSAELNTSASLRLEDALGFQHRDWEPYDLIDAAYTSNDGRVLTVNLKDETAGFGSRAAGEQMRTKCLNLLRGEQQLPLVLNWAGVPLVSSSFADEAIGKLHADLGPLTFGNRIQNVNMEPLVRSLVERAMVQRMAQSASRAP